MKTCRNCPHPESKHLTPGMECVAVIGRGKDGETFCPCGSFSDASKDLCKVRVWDGNGGDMTACGNNMPCPEH